MPHNPLKDRNFVCGHYPTRATAIRKLAKARGRAKRNGLTPAERKKAVVMVPSPAGFECSTRDHGSGSNCFAVCEALNTNDAMLTGSKRKRRRR